MEKISVNVLGSTGIKNAFDSDESFEVLTFSGRTFPLFTERPDDFPTIKASEVPFKSKEGRIAIARIVNGSGRKALVKEKGDWIVVDGTALTQPVAMIKGKGKTSYLQVPPAYSDTIEELVNKHPAFAGYTFEKVDAVPDYKSLIRAFSVFLRRYWKKNIVILDLSPSFLIKDKNGNLVPTKPDMEAEDHRRTALRKLGNMLKCKTISVPCEVVGTGMFDYTPEAYGYILSKVRAEMEGTEEDPALLDKVVEANVREYPDIKGIMDRDRKAVLEEFKTAYRSRNNTDREVAYTIARSLSYLGSPVAFHYLGLMYRYGKYVRKSKAHAIYWQRRAVDSGVDAARNELFDLLWTENGAYDVEMVNLIRNTYTRKAAVMANMAKAYLHGRGVDKDVAKAEELYRKAETMNGGDPTLGIMDVLWEIGTPAALNELKERCDSNGSYKAKTYLARLFAQGTVVPKDLDAAKALLDECIANGYTKADEVRREIFEAAVEDNETGLSDIVRSDLMSFDRHLLYIGNENPDLRKYAEDRNVEFVTENFTKHRNAYLVLDMNKLTESQKFPYDALIDRKGNDRTFMFCDYSVLDDKRKEYLRIVIFRLLAKHPGIHVVHTDVDDFETILDRTIAQHEEKALSEFDVEACVEEGTLKARITIRPTLEHMTSVMKYRFQVFRDNVLVHDAPLQEVPLFETNVKEDGLYTVRGYLVRDVCGSGKYSNAVSHFSDEFKAEADRLLDGDAVFDEIQVMPQRKPFQDLVLHVIGDGKPMDDLMAGEGLKNFARADIRNIGKINMYSEDCVSTAFQTQAFSGIYRYNDRIVTDGSSNVTLSNADYGCFTCLRHNRRFNTVTFFKDFCSYGRIFMYHVEGSTEYIFSNRYIRLLKTLRSLGKTLTFDREKALAGLSSDDRLLMQNFVHGMDVKEIQQLDPCGQVHVSFKGVVVENNTAVHEVLQDRQYTRDSQYGRILSNANKEVKENVTAALNTFGKVEQEVTGGLDSRCVLSAVMSTKAPRDSVMLTVDVEDPAEAEIALEVSAISGYGFEDECVKSEELDPAKTEMECRNHYLGTIYTYDVPKVRNEKMVCRLTGGTGNAFCRPEYSRYHFGDVGELSKDSREMAEAVWQHLCEDMVLDSAEAGKTFVDRLTEELERVDINNPVGKYDMLYFYYRNSYLFDPYMDAVNNLLKWMPLQSSNLFRAYNQTHDSFRNSRMEMEMIGSLAPSLTTVEYDSESDTAVFESVRDDLFTPVEKAPAVDIEKTVAEWGAANRKRGCGQTPAACEDIGEKLMNALRVLSKLDGGYFRENAGYALVYYALHNAKDYDVLETMYRKIVSIIDQYRMIE
ncbi:MAG: sel1 repeat family protein [archaeon]|nr:sel1 repeat family protein [archaeon]